MRASVFMFEGFELVTAGQRQRVLSILENSVKIVHDEHMSVLLKMHEPYLNKLEPGNNANMSSMLSEYNSDIRNELDRYGIVLCATLLQVKQNSGRRLNTILNESIRARLPQLLDPELYHSRFLIFLKAIELHQARYGLVFDIGTYKSGLDKTSAAVDTVNRCRRITRSIYSKMDLHDLAAEDDLAFECKGTVAWYSKVNQIYTAHPMTLYIAGALISVFGAFILG